jgi:hypothetical protein
MPPTNGLPPWRLELHRIPEGSRTSTQRELARAMDIVDELQTMYASSSPPPPSSSPTTERALVTALESMSYSFRGNMVYSLVPLSLYTAIMPEGVIKVAFERAFSQMASMTSPTSPNETVLFIAERLLTCVFAIKPAGMMMQQSSAAPMIHGLSMLESLLGTLRSDEGDAELAKLGSHLTVADLRAVTLYAKAIYMLEADAGKAVQQCTRVAVREVFETLEKGPICWYLMSNYSQVFDRAQKMQGVGQVNDIRVRVLRRYLIVAEQDKDPYREGWCAAELALWLMNKGVPYVEVEELQKQAEAAKERARQGLPAFTVKSGFRLLQGVQEAMETFRQQNPYSYTEQGIKLVMMSGGGQLGEVEVAVPPESDMRRCGACGAESRSMALCTGVS